MSNWRDPPDWAIKILRRQYYTILQNEAILAKLEDRSTRLSDADQKALDQFMDILKGTNEQIDSAKKDD